MKTVKEMLADVRADRDRRQQLEQEQEQKRLDIQKAVSMAEQEMKEALIRQDQEAYHAAEGRLSYEKAALEAFSKVDAWWTEEEANALIEAAFNACCAEVREKYKEAFDAMMKMEAAISAAEAIALDGSTLSNIIRQYRKSDRGWTFSPAMQHVPFTFATSVAQRAGTAYIPPKFGWANP